MSGCALYIRHALSIEKYGNCCYWTTTQDGFEDCIQWTEYLHYHIRPLSQTFRRKLGFWIFKKNIDLLLASSWLVQLSELLEPCRPRQSRSYISQIQLHYDNVLQVLEPSGKIFDDTKLCNRAQNDY
jgi:hypothetical protein